MVCAAKNAMAMLYSIRIVTVKRKKLMVEISFSARACRERVREGMGEGDEGFALSRRAEGKTNFPHNRLK